MAEYIATEDMATPEYLKTAEIDVGDLVLHGWFIPVYLWQKNKFAASPFGQHRLVPSIG